MGILIDSTVLIDLERRQLAPQWLRENQEEAWSMSSVTVAELLFGLERAATSEQRRRRQAFLDETLTAFPVLAFDLSVARVYARIWADLVRAGQRIGTHDFIIAATAIAHECTLLTDNVRVFERIPGLIVRQPKW